MEDIRTSRLASVSVAGSFPVLRYAIRPANSPSAACSSGHSLSSETEEIGCKAATVTSVCGVGSRGLSGLVSLTSCVTSVSGEIRESASATAFCYPGRYSICKSNSCRASPQCANFPEGCGVLRSDFNAEWSVNTLH